MNITLTINEFKEGTEHTYRDQKRKIECVFQLVSVKSLENAAKKSGARRSMGNLRKLVHSRIKPEDFKPLTREEANER